MVDRDVVQGNYREKANAPHAVPDYAQSVQVPVVVVDRCYEGELDQSVEPLLEGCEQDTESQEDCDGHVIRKDGSHRI